MQDNFQQSSMPHYSTATSIDGNGTNEGHCSFTTKYHGQGHTPIKIYPSLSTFLLLSQTQNNKTAIDSNLAESFFHFLGPKCDFLDAGKLAQGIEISTVFFFFLSLFLSSTKKREWCTIPRGFHLHPSTRQLFRRCTTAMDEGRAISDCILPILAYLL